jgi:hypothetical protein
VAVILIGIAYFIWSHVQHRVGAEPAIESTQD